MDENQLFGSEDSEASDDNEENSEANENAVNTGNLFGDDSSSEEDVEHAQEEGNASSDEDVAVGSGDSIASEGKENVASGSDSESLSDRDNANDEEVEQVASEEEADQESEEEAVQGSEEEAVQESEEEAVQESEEEADQESEENEQIVEKSQDESDDDDDDDDASRSDASETVNQQRTVIAEDSDQSSNEDIQTTEKVDNLFGDADDISSSDDEDNEEVSRKVVIDDNEDDVDDAEKVQRHVTEDDDDEDDKNAQLEEPQTEKEIMETRIEVEIPKINTDLGSAIHFVRFPNFISVEARPFDPVVYEDEIEEDELLDEEGRTRLKLKVENTIRWRKYLDENNIELTESNARMVRWSDGSMSMHLGSEIFDVHQMSLQGDHNHLYIRQGTGLQGQAVFNTKLSFRPHSTKSATHKRMTNRLAMRHNQNQQKVRVLPMAGQDPESRKAKLMKEEEEQLKAHVRREAQKRRMRERSHARGLNSNYLEDRYEEGTTNDDDDEGISVSAIKNRFHAGTSGNKWERPNIYSSDSESESEKRLIKVKRLSSDDDDDDDVLDGKRKKTEDGETRRKTYVVDDEEDMETSSP